MKHFILFFSVCFVLTACRSSHSVTNNNNKNESSSSTTTITKTNCKEAKSYTANVAKVKANKTCISASAKAKIKYGNSDLSVNAQLRMKRDDVVRLSLRFLGVEVGVLEFTPQDVLVVDRMNKRYVRTAYSDVSFLSAAELDFYSLQSLFWDELFVPGERSAENFTSRFTMSERNSKNILTLSDSPRLTYTFTTSPTNYVVEQLLVKGKNSNDKGQFAWSYTNFEKFAGRSFPTTMQMTVSGIGKDVSLNLNLSNLKSDSDWNTRTTISSKYTRMSIDEVLNGLKF